MAMFHSEQYAARRRLAPGRYARRLHVKHMPASTVLYAVLPLEPALRHARRPPAPNAGARCYAEDAAADVPRCHAPDAYLLRADIAARAAARNGAEQPFVAAHVAQLRAKGVIPCCFAQQCRARRS